MFDEEPRCRNVLRKVKWSISIVVGNIDVPTAVQKQLEDLEVVVRGCGMDGSIPVVVLHVG